MNLIRFFYLVICIVLTSCSAQNKKNVVKIGILPIADSFPLIIAEKLGFLKNENFEVKLVNFQSALEKDTAFQSGSIDAMITDVVVSSLLKKRGFDIKICFNSTAKRLEMPRVAILASPKNKIQRKNEHEKQEIAIASNCIIEFVTDELMKKQFPQIIYNKLNITNIPLRLSMLLEDKIMFATLTDPYLDYALSKGASIVCDDLNYGLYQIVFSCKSNIIQEKINFIIEGYNTAVELINSNPNKYYDNLKFFCNLPSDLSDILKMHSFERAQPIRESDVEKIFEWLEIKKIILDSSDKKNLFMSF